MIESAAILEAPPDWTEEQIEPRKPSRREALFRAFFAELEERAIPYVLLHGYDEMPAHIASDVDVAVASQNHRHIAPLIAWIAREHGWKVVQSWEYALGATYTVLFDSEDVSASLALDVSSHIVSDGAILMRDNVLLEGRLRHPRGFFIPAPASEFAYLLVKALIKPAAFSRYLPRLRNLANTDRKGTKAQILELLGEDITTDPREWLQSAESRRDALVVSLRMRAAKIPFFAGSEFLRRMRRLRRPSGLQVSVLGPDGSGKSTLIAALQRTLAPAFTAQRVCKFRPDVFNRIEPETQSQPHVREPRSVPVSWLKVLYYFCDWWLGWLLKLKPARHRGVLFVFDRDFQDLTIDQRRYLVAGVGPLVSLLRRFVPRSDVTFIIEDAPEAIHARKPELSVPELYRQRDAYRRLGWSIPRACVVSAGDGAETVRECIGSKIIDVLAQREASRARNLAKRVFDVSVAGSALLLLLPLFAIIALLVATKLGTPIIFRQQRPGLHGAPFTIAKFRTMTNARDAHGRLLSDAQRLTRFGKWLRSTSLDELPELWNVLRGDMSIVGPRPLLMDYLPLYSRTQRRRHDVLPGITGWAQINGRNAASWPQKFALDLWYIDNQSLRLDLKIIVKTAAKVILREGISQPGRATADRFRGEQFDDRDLRRTPREGAEA